MRAVSATVSSTGVQEVQQVTYSLEGWWFNPRLLQSACQISLGKKLSWSTWIEKKCLCDWGELYKVLQKNDSSLGPKDQDKLHLRQSAWLVQHHHAAWCRRISCCYQRVLCGSNTYQLALHSTSADLDFGLCFFFFFSFFKIRCTWNVAILWFSIILCSRLTWEVLNPHCVHQGGVVPPMSQQQHTVSHEW